MAMMATQDEDVPRYGEVGKPEAGLQVSGAWGGLMISSSEEGWPRSAFGARASTEVPRYRLEGFCHLPEQANTRSGQPMSGAHSTSPVLCYALFYSTLPVPVPVPH